VKGQCFFPSHLNNSTMKKAHLHLIKYAIKKGYSISVQGDDDGPTLVKSKSINAVKKEVEDFEVARIHIYEDGTEGHVASALLTPYEAPEETVCDYSVCLFMDSWQKAYDRNIGGTL